VKRAYVVERLRHFFSQRSDSNVVLREFQHPLANFPLTNFPHSKEK
jgi:hypothetical protein